MRFTWLRCWRPKSARKAIPSFPALARGIDTAAHRSALAEPAPLQPFLPAALTIRIPPKTLELWRKPSPERGGAVITEMPLRMGASREGFSKTQSLDCRLGSLGLVGRGGRPTVGLTHQRAAGRMNLADIVFAAPGSPLDPRTSGINNGLIKEGAVRWLPTRETLLMQLAPMTRKPISSKTSMEEPN
jgi:predicted Rossmann fold nucleotide-binding protein DprA/Smf involved in DNA uptake